MADQTDLDEERRVRVEQLMADEGLSWGEAWKLSEPEFTGAEYLSPTLWATLRPYVFVSATRSNRYSPHAESRSLITA